MEKSWVLNFLGGRGRRYSVLVISEVSKSSMRSSKSRGEGVFCVGSDLWSLRISNIGEVVQHRIPPVL